jgi:hypothetical protein
LERLSRRCFLVKVQIVFPETCNYGRKSCCSKLISRGCFLAHCCLSSPPQNAAVRPVRAAIRCNCKICEGRTHRLRTKRPDARAAIADAAFVRSCGNFYAAMQPASLKRPFKATISVGFKPTFRRVMFEFTDRGQSVHSLQAIQCLLLGA